MISSSSIRLSSGSSWLLAGLGCAFGSFSISPYYRLHSSGICYGRFGGSIYGASITLPML